MIPCLRTALLALLLCAGTGAFQSSFGGQRVAVKHAVQSSSSLLMQMPIVDDWKILKSGELVGTVRNHPVLDDGDVIKTSPLANPEGAAATKVVSTSSGSKYRLGNPSIAQLKANGQVSPGAATQQDDAKALKAALAKAKSDYKLTGLLVGNGNYLLAGRPRRSTSGKATIFTCYRNDGNGLPVGEPLCAKISTNIEALRRESKNYDKVTSGLNRGQFVKFLQFYGRAGDSKGFVTQSAIIMERGIKDLKAFIEENGPLQGKQLRDSAVAAVQCLQAMHSSNLVWTDMKPENFVVTDTTKFTIKGIDLESAMAIRDNPVDYSPEACPPEFAEAFLAGDGPYFILDYSYDIWSLGMLLYEISTGKTYFKGKNPADITKALRNPSFVADTSDVPDDKLRDLIKSCLDRDPKQRPTLTQILLHPFFLTTGFGPFSF
jgi:serine/threonine protein kinase